MASLPGTHWLYSREVTRIPALAPARKTPTMELYRRPRGLYELLYFKLAYRIN